MEKTKRIYNLRDADMLALAEVFYAAAQTNLQDFTSFDSTLNLSFLQNFRMDIDQARTLLTDDVISDNLAQHNADLEAAMQAARDKYLEVKYFVSKKFKNQAAILNQFGLNDYDEIRIKPDGMVVFLNNLYQTALRYENELVLSGYDATRIQGIETVGNQLTQILKNRDIYAKERLVLTQERVDIYNKVYEYLQNWRDAANFVFMNDFARRQIFLIPYRSSNAQDSEIDVTVNVGETKLVFDSDINEDSILRLSNTGNSNLRFFVGTSANPASAIGTGIEIVPNEVQSLSPTQLGDANATHLFVENVGTQIGSFVAEMMN